MAAAEHAAAASAADALDSYPLLVGKQDNTTLTGNLLAHVWARPDKGWLLAFAIAMAGPARSSWRSRLPWWRASALGQQHSGRLGLRHHQLRLVDRHRPRWDADQRNPLPLPAALADGDQSLQRGDDHLRGDVRGLVPAAAHRATVVRLLLFPYPRPWRCGRSSRARSSGTCSRSRPTSPSRCCSGTWASSPTWPRCATPQEPHPAEGLRRRKPGQQQVTHLVVASIGAPSRANRARRCRRPSAGYGSRCRRAAWPGRGRGPRYQNSSETVKYVETANTSQMQRARELRPELQVAG